MKDLYLKINPEAKKIQDLSDNDLFNLASSFYYLASRMAAKEFQTFYNDVLAFKFEQLQTQSEVVLGNYKYNIFLELKVIQFIDDKSNLVNLPLLEVRQWVVDNYPQLTELELLAAIGFYYSEKAYKILQISNGAWIK